MSLMQSYTGRKLVRPKTHADRPVSKLFTDAWHTLVRVEGLTMSGCSYTRQQSMGLGDHSGRWRESLLACCSCKGDL